MRSFQLAMCGVLGVLPSVATASLVHVGNYPAVSAEIVSYDSATSCILATADTGVEVVDFSDPASLARKSLVSFEGVFAGDVSVSNVSSVAADPAGRGFGAAALIPSNDHEGVGKVVLFDTATGAVLNSFDVGYHPDCVTFSDDGGYVVVANEGEWFDGGPQTPGSVSVLTLGAAMSKSALASLSQSACATYDFSAANLAAGVSYEGFRVSDPSGEGLPNGLEPEYVSCVGGKVYTSIQESSVIGVLDIQQGKWTALYQMPAVLQTIDASDKDGGVHIDDSAVLCLPMPDTIHAFMADGYPYIVTANEGDFRPDDGDKCRVADLGTDGTPGLDAAYLAELNALYDGDALASTALGRLNVSTIDGLNASGEIAQLYVPGARSFSVMDAATGDVVWDSGSDFETLTAKLDPSGYVDSRSDDKGPEPEGICTFEIGAERYVAIVMERTAGVFIYNITNPTHPIFADYIRSQTSEAEPESVFFLSAEQSPDGVAKLVVSYEAACSIDVFDLFSWGGYLSAETGGDINTNGWLGWLYAKDGWLYSWDMDAWLYMEPEWVGPTGSWAYFLK